MIGGVALAELDSEPSERLKVMMVLTDGKPNVNPPDGNLQTLVNYRDSHPGLSVLTLLTLTRTPTLNTADTDSDTADSQHC